MDWQPKFSCKEIQTYPFRVELRPRDQSLSMNKDIVPWLNANVSWSRDWTMENDGPTAVTPNGIFFRFDVASFEDAMLIRFRFS